MLSIYVDKYSQNVKHVGFYLVMYLGRGICTKFPKIHLKINSKLYYKAPKTPVPEDIQYSAKKYFDNRYTLLGRFDKVFQMDEVG